MKKRNLKILAVILTVGLAGVIVALTAAAASAPVLPGITSKDNYPNGCVDCHKKDGATDNRLNAVLAKIKGHPDISKVVKTIPADCEMCHKGGTGKAPLIAQVAHEFHYKEAATNVFVTTYGGQCLNCHALVVDTGVMKTKPGPANW
jgi:cytochrome c5